MKTKKEELQAELTRLNALRKQVKDKLKDLPVYELNRWYKHPNGSLYFINKECEDGHLYGYGFDNDGYWSVMNNDESSFCAFNSVAKKEIILASADQVEKDLIEEAKKRGFVNGCVGNNSNIHNTKLNNCELFFKNEFEFNEKENTLRIILDYEVTWVVFKDGQWATIIEQDKFAELKEAHRNGSKIQCRLFPFNNELGWLDDNNPSWSVHFEYRIKPEEKPTLKDNDIAIIERLHDALLDNHGYDLNSTLLSDSRELCKRIQCIIEKGAN